MSIANTTATKKAAEKEPVSIAVATDGIRIPRATSGPVLDLDLITMAEQLRYEAAWSDGRNSRTLVKHTDFRLILTVMRPGARLHSHQARGTVLIQVMSGRIRARVLDDIVDVYGDTPFRWIRIWNTRSRPWRKVHFSLRLPGRTILASRCGPSRRHSGAPVGLARPDRRGT